MRKINRNTLTTLTIGLYISLSIKLYFMRNINIAVG